MTRKILTAQAGFSLLEMMLVLLILSTLAFSALDFVGNEDNQVRFEETRRRLDLIRRAVIGETGAVYNGQRLLSGYVADNGLLPLAIQGLISLPTDYENFGAQSPIFDSDPVAATGKNDSTNQTTLGNPQEQLFKGWPAGGYIAQSASINNQFRDGWGNDTVDSGGVPNYGWTVAISTGVFTTTSRGADDAVGGSLFNTDIPITVNAGDWQGGDTAGWQVDLRNTSGTDINFATGGLGLSLLVYENFADSSIVNDFRWRRFSTNVVPCLDGNGDDLVSGVPCANGHPGLNRVTLTFLIGSAYPLPGLTTTTIPQGEHLLVVFQDDDTSPHNGAATTEFACSASCNTGTARTTQRVDFFARASRPNIEVVIQ